MDTERCVIWDLHFAICQGVLLMEIIVTVSHNLNYEHQLSTNQWLVNASNQKVGKNIIKKKKKK